MKTTLYLSLLLAAAGTAAISAPASAQYTSDIVNGLTNVVLPAVSGNAAYKGYVEGDYTIGLGSYRTTFVTLATSQGYQFAPWFYMGAGVGVDLLLTQTDGTWADDWAATNPTWYDHQKTEAAIMIPIFTDFRFIFGPQTDLGFFINLRIGASLLCTDSYVKVGDGYFTNDSYFYLQPAVGMRIPINKSKPRQALDIGLHYRFMNARYWSGWVRNSAINGFGLNISYEW